jgi:hypothetical protein
VSSVEQHIRAVGVAYDLFFTTDPSVSIASTGRVNEWNILVDGARIGELLYWPTASERCPDRHWSSDTLNLSMYFKTPGGAVRAAYREYVKERTGRGVA